MYARHVGGRTLTFDFAEGLIKNNLLIVDRQTRSVWSQLHGRAVIGPMKDTPLQAIASLQATWGFWHARHPDTRVMVLKDTVGRPYFYRNQPTGQSSPKEPTPTHDLSALGFGLSVDGQSWWASVDSLAKASLPLDVQLGSSQFKVFYDSDGMTAWAEDSGGQLAFGVMAYQQGWFDFMPDSRRFVP